MDLLFLTSNKQNEILYFYDKKSNDLVTIMLLSYEGFEGKKDSILKIINENDLIITISVQFLYKCEISCT